MSRLAAVTLLTTSLMLAACGGGGGSGSGSSGGTIGTQEVAPTGSRMLSFSGDIEPIMQGKCLGCHNDGPNPLAPFSLEGESAVRSFKSAMHFVIESGTMPPEGAPQLSAAEHDKLIAWLTDSPYTPTANTVRVALVAAQAWDVNPSNQDVYLDHRPEQVNCARDTGWLVEEDELEVRTQFCNYLSLTQQSLLNLPAGTELELALSHSDLDYNAPAMAHVAITIGGNTLWQKDISIPGESEIIRQTVTLPFAIEAGDPINMHLHNHGNNTWGLHAIDALVPQDLDLEYCKSYENTWDAIQDVVFEQAGCANSLCHGEGAESGLDLRPEVAYDNLVGVRAQGSSLLLVDPKYPAESYLYRKLSAKTFPGSYDVGGSPMPSAGPAISAGKLEALRWWIETGAPETGSIGDTLGRGEDEIERLLGVCLPEAEAINTQPLPPPERTVGVQFSMPPHEVPAESEREICFATYYDFRDVIPPEYMDADRENFYISGTKLREDPFTHHNVLFYAAVGMDQIHDPAFGEWTCVEGERDGEVCEPTDLDSCGDGGYCRSAIGENLACRGYGPRFNQPKESTTTEAASGSDEEVFGVLRNIFGTINGLEGFYEEIPTHGVFYWNSHAFNLTTQDGIHHVWRNFYFADDRRFKAENITYVDGLTDATGTPPFEKRTVCRDFVFEQGDGLLSLSSHTHKRGEYFYMSIKGGEQIYETFDYEEPLIQNYNPPIVFNSSDPVERTLEFCAVYNNGVNSGDGSPNIETVTRLSRRPTNAKPCVPTACVAGKIGAPCHGADDDAACDSSPGAGDGWCDACPITAGVTSDDEMFVMIGERLPNHDAQVAK